MRTLRGERSGRDQITVRARLGEQLLQQGTIRRRQVRAALQEQARTGGRIGEILYAQGAIGQFALRVALAEHHNLPSLVDEYEAVPIIPRPLAYAVRAVVLAGPHAAPGDGVLLVAVTDIAVARRLRLLLRRPIEPRLTDERRMDELLADAYAHLDGPATGVALRRGLPRRSLAVLGWIAVVCAAVALTLYAYLHPVLVLELAVAALGLVWLALAALSLGDRRRGRAIRWRPQAAVVPVAGEGSAALCTVLAPLRHESEGSLQRLTASLEALEHPRHRLQTLALIDPTDRATRRALRRHPLPPWVSVLTIPREAAHGRRGSLLYGLLQARGRLVAVADGHGSLARDAFAHPVSVTAGYAVGGSLARVGRWGARQQLKARFLRQADLSRTEMVVVAAGGHLRRDAVSFFCDELRTAFHWPVVLVRTYL